MPTDIDNLIAVTDKTVFLDVVGVIKDVKLRDIAEGEKGVGAYYFPMSQNTSSFLTFAVKTSAAPETVAVGRGAAAAIGVLAVCVPATAMAATTIAVDPAARPAARRILPCQREAC